MSYSTRREDTLSSSRETLVLQYVVEVTMRVTRPHAVVLSTLLDYGASELQRIILNIYPSEVTHVRFRLIGNFNLMFCFE